MAPKYKLMYFNLMGRAEPIRLIFAEAGVEYEDYRFKEGEWPTVKDKLPFGQAPVLEVDGHMLSQSITIARYLANEFGLAGKTAWEKAHADELADGFIDIFPQLRPIFMEKDPEKKKEIWKKVESEFLHPFISRFEGFLTKNGTGFFVGKDLTYADLVIFHMLSFLKAKHPDTFKDHKTMSDFIDRIASRDKIKDWIEKRPKTER